MSYVLTAYVLDIAILKSAIGSKDKSIIEDLEPVIADTFDEDDEDEAAEADEHRASVQALVMGEQLDPEHAARYGCALWDICRVKGEELLPDAWGGVRWDSVQACGLEELLTKTGPPVVLPPNPDIPHIAYIKRNKIDQHIEAAEKKKDETDNGGVVGLLDEYIEWLQTAQSQNKDIVLIYG